MSELMYTANKRGVDGVELLAEDKMNSRETAGSRQTQRDSGYGATFIEQFLEPPVFQNYPEHRNPDSILIPTFCTFLKIPVIDDADRLL